MNREEFLQQTDVKSFLNWLCSRISSLTFDINILASHRVPDGIALSQATFDSLITNYHWEADWTNSNGDIVRSSDWQSTKSSLLKLHHWLNHSKDELDMLNACKAVMHWYGNSGGTTHLNHLFNSNKLTQYLTETKQLLCIDTANLDIVGSADIPEYGPALSVIHALMSDDGLPFYDERIGAAICALTLLFRRETGEKGENIIFPVGRNTGNLVRDPGEILFRATKKLGSPAVGFTDWVNAQIKLGWLTKEVLARTSLFRDEKISRERAMAFTITLFLIGYDLKGFPVNVGNIAEEPKSRHQK